MTQNIIKGSNNMQLVVDVQGNITIINTQTPPVIRQTVKVEPQPDAISTEQQAALKALVNEWVALSAVIKMKPILHVSAWSSLNKAMKAPRYTEIKAVDFEKAKAFIQRQMAILRSAKSAPKKDASWRNSRYTAVHAKCATKELKDWRFKVLKEKYGVESMKELSDNDLDAFYRTVMGK